MPRRYAKADERLEVRCKKARHHPLHYKKLVPSLTVLRFKMYRCPITDSEKLAHKLFIPSTRIKRHYKPNASAVPSFNFNILTWSLPLHPLPARYTSRSSGKTTTKKERTGKVIDETPKLPRVSFYANETRSWV